jgi:hypothetical protein
MKFSELDAKVLSTKTEKLTALRYVWASKCTKIAIELLQPAMTN